MVILEEGGDTLMSQSGAVMEAIKREAQKIYNISIAPKAENVRGRADTECQSNGFIGETLTLASRELDGSSLVKLASRRANTSPYLPRALRWRTGSAEPGRVASSLVFNHTPSRCFTIIHG